MLTKKDIISKISLLYLVFISLNINAQTFNLIALNDSVEVKKTFKVHSKKVDYINLVTTEPVRIMNLLIAIYKHPDQIHYSSKWPVVKNKENFPRELYPLLGTFPDGQFLRDYLSHPAHESIPVEKWYKAGIEEYFEFNSNGKFEVEVLFPKTRTGKVYETDTDYYQWVEENNNQVDNLVLGYGNWHKMATEVMMKLVRDDPNVFDNVKLINLIYLVPQNEFSTNITGLSPDGIFEFKNTDNNTRLYKGYVTLCANLNTVLHETLHRIGSLVDEPEGFEGLPDRSSKEFFDYPRNRTWGHDIMYNNGQFPSSNALYGYPPMLTTDRIFFNWIDQSEVLEIHHENKINVKLKDVNFPLSPDDKTNGFYRVAKVMIHENFKDELDEYFLVEFRNGTGFDRNFYNIYETQPHTGIFILHVKENTNMLNRSRNNDHFYDMEIAVPYNGWFGNPIPDDDFPRNYDRPADYYKTNPAGDFDYYDDHSSPPYLPDGGVHLWETTDTTHSEWRPFYLRRNTLTTNFFSDDTIRGHVKNEMTNYTRPSTKDWEGNITNIAIKNIKRHNGYMSFDVYYNYSSTDIVNNHKIDEYSLENNYPNPFGGSHAAYSSLTTIKYKIANRGKVKLEVFDVLGRRISKLVDKIQDKGEYTVTFSNNINNKKLPSGIYFYSLEVNNFRKVNKMILIE